MSNLKFINPKPDSRHSYLTVPYSEKDYVKANGAKWSRHHKLWYISKDSLLHDQLIKKYPFRPYNVVYLRVPYAEKDAVKSLGAVWDNVSKLWLSKYGPDGFERWINAEHVLTDDDILSLSEDEILSRDTKATLTISGSDIKTPTVIKTSNPIEQKQALITQVKTNRRRKPVRSIKKPQTSKTSKGRIVITPNPETVQLAKEITKLGR